jgi:hypothetical protein
MSANLEFEIIDKASRTEASADFADKLAEKEKQDLFEDKGRATKYKRHLHRIVVLLTYVIASLLAVALTIRSFHLLAPICWRWLSSDELHSIDTVLFSSVIFSLGSRYFEYYKLFQNDK